MRSSTERDRRWLTRWGPVDSVRAGCAARTLLAGSAVPASWCPLVVLIQQPGAAAGDVVFVVGAVGFLVAFGGALVLIGWSARLARVESEAREAGWSTLAARVANERAVVEGATARAAGHRVVSSSARSIPDTPVNVGGG